MYKFKQVTTSEFLNFLQTQGCLFFSWRLKRCFNLWLPFSWFSFVWNWKSCFYVDMDMVISLELRGSNLIDCPIFYTNYWWLIRLQYIYKCLWRACSTLPTFLFSNQCFRRSNDELEIAYFFRFLISSSQYTWFETMTICISKITYR